MRIRLTPRQNSFYGMFATSGRNLMEGAGLLKEMLGADLSERKEIAERMRGASTPVTRRPTRSCAS